VEWGGEGKGQCEVGRGNGKKEADRGKRRRRGSIVITPFMKKKECRGVGRKKKKSTQRDK